MMRKNYTCNFSGSLCVIFQKFVHIGIYWHGL
jgi:cytochrome c oxidase assembly protein subunit 15